MTPLSLPTLLDSQLARWSAALRVESPGPTGWRVDGPLPVELQSDLSICLGPWRHPFDPDDALEMLDLLAAALFGRARVWVYAHAELPAGHRLEVATTTGWVDAGGQTPRRRWFRTPTKTLLCNDRSAPDSIRWGEAGRLPNAPWVGMLEVEPAGPGTLPIDGELDLHLFKPKEVKNVVVAYIEACVARGLTDLRLVHGKGIGNLRRTVHALLEKHPAVERYRLGGMGEGSWGATVVTLRRTAKAAPDGEP
ncbi:MAG: Smr/MutS family protein [Nannocystales bacterium]